jgi:hypothetical protein
MSSMTKQRQHRPYLQLVYRRTEDPYPSDQRTRSQSRSRSHTHSPAPSQPPRSRSTACADAHDALFTLESIGECGDDTTFVQRAEYPRLPASVPLSYTLTMAACLSERPSDRPSFSHLLVLLHDMAIDAATGQYINSVGVLQVCTVLTLMCWTPGWKDARSVAAGAPLRRCCLMHQGCRTWHTYLSGLIP